MDSLYIRGVFRGTLGGMRARTTPTWSYGQQDEELLH